MVAKKIAVLPGDGIGPEIMSEGVKVLRAVEKKYSHGFIIIYADFGAGVYFTTEHSFPDTTREVCNLSDAILKGPIGLDAKGTKELQARGVKLELETVIALRQMFDTYANYRPVVLPKNLADFSPLRPEVIGDGIDILMMRELIGGIYFGPKTEGKDTAMQYARDDCTYTREQVERFARVCFKEARKRKAKLTNVHKANVLATSRFWNSVFDRVAQEYPDVRYDSMLVDNVAYQLVINPTQFNGVMALENMQGDILTDQGGGILGSLGLMPSACLNPETGRGFFEPAHGSAPGIAGQSIANPYSMIGSVAFMLEKAFGLEQEARDVWNALTDVFAQGYRTRELARTSTPLEKVVSTTQFGDLVVEGISK